MTAARLLTLVLAVLAALQTGCSRPAPAAAAGSPAVPFKLAVQLDWVAEPEHGAFYTAEALERFK